MLLPETWKVRSTSISLSIRSPSSAASASITAALCVSNSPRFAMIANASFAVGPRTTFSKTRLILLNSARRRSGAHQRTAAHNAPRDADIAQLAAQSVRRAAHTSHLAHEYAVACHEDYAHFSLIRPGLARRRGEERVLCKSTASK